MLGPVLDSGTTVGQAGPLASQTNKRLNNDKSAGNARAEATMKAYSEAPNPTCYTGEVGREIQSLFRMPHHQKRAKQNKESTDLALS